ncbi:MAG TPA: transglycosylase SLT domain-containing protein [Gemmatimonadaceae bacterium]|nr:transglycosylase SLT domain-containing protein [Gemmatimonadaceae bacterium]
MKDLRGTYVHRGDRERRRRRFRAGFMLAGLLAAATLAARNWEPGEASAAAPAGGTAVAAPHHDGVADQRAGFSELQRWHHIHGYARRYKISSALAEAIYEAAIAERLDPALAFPLVRLESRFHERALSPVGAIGLTQLMLPTARFYKPGVTREELYDRDLNLRIGFRYLRDMIKTYKGNVQLALLVYNRGPTAVELDRRLGIDPSNGYDRIVLRGYKGKGILD